MEEQPLNSTRLVEAGNTLINSLRRDKQAMVAANPDGFDLAVILAWMQTAKMIEYCRQLDPSPDRDSALAGFGQICDDLYHLSSDRPATRVVFGPAPVEPEAFDLQRARRKHSDLSKQLTEAIEDHRCLQLHLMKPKKPYATRQIRQTNSIRRLWKPSGNTPTQRMPTGTKAPLGSSIPQSHSNCRLQ